MDKRKNKKHLNDRVIAVDRNFLPMMEVSRRHAIKALVTLRAEALDLSDWSRLAFYEMESFKEFQIIIYPSASAIKESKITVGRGFRGILERDKHVCQYCGPDGNKATTIDHVLPKSRGGGSNPGNLVAACSSATRRRETGLLTRQECL